MENETVHSLGNLIDTQSNGVRFLSLLFLHFSFSDTVCMIFFIIITLEINIARHMRNRWEPGKDMGMRQLENCLVPAGQ